MDKLLKWVKKTLTNENNNGMKSKTGILATEDLIKFK